MPKIKSHTFRGKRYGIRMASPEFFRKYDKKTKSKGYTIGLCNPPNKKGKKLYFDKTNKGLEELEIFIHEPYHVLQDRYEECAVEEEARDLAKFLWRLGYRRLNDKQLSEFENSKKL